MMLITALFMSYIGVPMCKIGPRESIETVLHQITTHLVASHTLT